MLLCTCVQSAVPTVLCDSDWVSDCLDIKGAAVLVSCLCWWIGSVERVGGGWCTLVVKAHRSIVALMEFLCTWERSLNLYGFYMRGWKSCTDRRIHLKRTFLTPEKFLCSELDARICQKQAMRHFGNVLECDQGLNHCDYTELVEMGQFCWVKRSEDHPPRCICLHLYLAFTLWPDLWSPQISTVKITFTWI